MKTMVWGAFWDDGRFNCYIMDRDFELKKYGYLANFYLEVLNDEFDFIFEEIGDGYVFM